MKTFFKKSLRAMARIWILFLVAAASVMDGAIASDSSGSSAHLPACCQKELKAGSSLPDSSIYQLESRWTNDASNSLNLATLRGRPQIMVMFFAQCQFACPLLVHAMKQIEAGLPPHLRTNVGFALVSFDTERDTPEVLAKYRKTHDLGTNWNLLRGNPDDVLELGALLGVKFKKDSAGNFAHSNVITLLNCDGEIAFQEVGLNRDPLTMVEAVQKLVK